MSAQYEFTAEQNETLRSLSTKMRGVGIFLVFVGMLNLLICGLTLAVIYQDQLPAEVTERMTPEVRSELDKLPGQDRLWAVAINCGVVGLLHLCLGGWTRSAGGAFRRITTTENKDITHLMKGMGALSRMYGLLYMLLVIALLLIVIGLGVGLYSQFMPMA